MSGHSKWATIHRQKEVKDAKKGAVFTKLAAAITVAVKQGRGLQLALEKAKQFNMPKDNIQRAVDRATESGGGDLVEAMYEGFGLDGVAVIVETLTDNKMRTAQAVRMVFEKNGGTLGSSGSVGYMFEQKGELRITNNKLGDEDELKIIDLGIEDLEKSDEVWIIYCEKGETFEIKQALENLGYKVESTELVMRPMTTVQTQKGESLLEQLEDLDDVQKVWTNSATG